MSRYIVVLVELGLRSLLLVLSIYCTIYIIVSYNYTFIQYVLVHLQINGTGYTYDNSDAILYIIVYITIMTHLPIMLCHIYIYMSPILYKHELYSIIIKGLYVLFVVYVFNKVCFTLVLPIYIVMITDRQFNMGQDVILDMSSYISMVKWILLIGIVYIISRYIRFTYSRSTVSLVSIYRRMYRLVRCLLFVVSDDVSIEPVLALAFSMTIITEIFIALYIILTNVSIDR